MLNLLCMAVAEPSTSLVFRKCEKKQCLTTFLKAGVGVGVRSMGKDIIVIVF
jgi:hypothetical protein